MKVFPPPPDLCCKAADFFVSGKQKKLSDFFGKLFCYKEAF